jgi:hypothetical protein
MDRPASSPAVDLSCVAILPADDSNPGRCTATTEDIFAAHVSACDFACVCSGKELRAHLESFLI